jgi:hypothetical protein
MPICLYMGKGDGMRRSRISIAFSMIFLGVILLAYQNCGKQNFAMTDAPLSVGLVLEDGRIAFNKATVKAEFMNLKHSYVRMKIAENGQFSGIFWKDFENPTQVSLVVSGSDYSNGKQDGLKTVKAQLERVDGQILELEATIGLDTVSPDFRGENLLEKGSSGESYALNQRVTLDWDAYDVPSTHTGYESGLDIQKAIKVNWLNDRDCSSSEAQSLLDWMPPVQSGAVLWPSDDPLSTFYFCLHVKDAAGNEISRPFEMSGLWRVIAGDNSQGNGGTVNAPNVRFAYPNHLGTDSNGNLFIFDSNFFNIRVVTNDGRMLRFAGTGQNGEITDDLKNSKIPWNTAFDFDSRDQMILGGKYKLYLLNIKDLEAGDVEVTELAKDMPAYVYPRVDRATDTVYLGTFKNGREALDNDNYIFKAPLSEILAFPGENGGRLPNKEDFIARWRLAGNGHGFLYENPTDPGDPVRGPLPDIADVEEPTGAVRNIALGENGEVFYFTFRSSDNEAFGRHQIRVIKEDSNQELKNILVYDSRVTSSQNISWTQTMVVERDSTSKYLLLTGGDFKFARLRITDMTSPQLFEDITLLEPSSTDLLSSAVLGLTSARGTPWTEEAKYFLADGGKSRVLALNESLQTIDSYGRKIYQPEDEGQLGRYLAVNTPVGITEDAQGRIYMLEAYSSIIRYLDSDEKLHLLSGKPFESQQMPANTDFSFAEMKFYTNSEASGQPHAMLYHPQENSIYLSEGWAGIVRKLNLDTQVVSTLPYGVGRDVNDVRGWLAYDFDLWTDPDDQQEKLIISRELGKYPYGAAITKLTGTLEEELEIVSPVGTRQPGEWSLSYANAVTQDGTIYFSQQSTVSGMCNGLCRLEPGSTPNYTQISGELIRAMDILELGDGITHIFGVSRYHSEIWHYSCDDQGSCEKEQLALPGTFLVAPQGLFVSQDQQLVIADTKNCRVLKYFITDKEGRLRFKKHED